MCRACDFIFFVNDTATTEIYPLSLHDALPIWRGSGAGEADPIQNLSRKHYLKEIFLDSATTAAVLSVVPTSPDTRNPLPIEEASETIDTVNRLANSKRAVIHEIGRAHV